MINKLTKKVHLLKHGDKVVINGRKGIVGTIGGYAAEYQENPYELIAHENKLLAAEPYRRNVPAWVTQECTCICADRGYYEQQRAEWAAAIQIKDGELAWLEGKLWEMKYAGDYSNMASFTAVTASKATAEYDEILTPVEA